MDSAFGYYGGNIGNQSLYPVTVMQNSEIAQSRELSAVIFEEKPYNLSKGQIGLLHLLNSKLLSKEPVTLYDIVRLYYSVRGKMVKRYFNIDDLTAKEKTTVKISGRMEWPMQQTDTSAWRYCYFPLDVYISRFGCNGSDLALTFNPLNWIKTNLGNLILKGAIVAIPVLQIGQDAIKSLESEK